MANFLSLDTCAPLEVAIAVGLLCKSGNFPSSDGEQGAGVVSTTQDDKIKLIPLFFPDGCDQLATCI